MNFADLVRGEVGKTKTAEKTKLIDLVDASKGDRDRDGTVRCMKVENIDLFMRSEVLNVLTRA